MKKRLYKKRKRNDFLYLDQTQAELIDGHDWYGFTYSMAGVSFITKGKKAQTKRQRVWEYWPLLDFFNRFFYDTHKSSSLYF